MNNKRQYLTALAILVTTILLINHVYPLMLWFVVADGNTPIDNFGFLFSLIIGIASFYYIIKKINQSKLNTKQSNILLIISIIITSWVFYTKADIGEIDGSTPVEAVQSYLIIIYPNEPLDNFKINETGRRKLPRINGEYIEYEILLEENPIYLIGVATRSIYWWSVGFTAKIDVDNVSPGRPCSVDGSCKYLDCSIYETTESTAKCVINTCHCEGI